MGDATQDRGSEPVALRHQPSGGFVGEGFGLVPSVEDALWLTAAEAHRIVFLMACEPDAYETCRAAIVA